MQLTLPLITSFRLHATTVLVSLKQVLLLVKFVNEFIVSNPFIVCSDELSYVKKQLYRERDELKVKQKAGVIQYKAYQGRSVISQMTTIPKQVQIFAISCFRYFLDFVLTVPNEYPAKHVM